MARPIPPRFRDVLLPTNVRLSYVEQGDPTGPAVILLHGLADSWLTWSDILPRLSPTLHVFALSQRGHGDSERPAHGYRVGDSAEDVIAFMDAFGLASASLAGHGVGGRVARHAASIAPERIDGLLLAGASRLLEERWADATRPTMPVRILAGDRDPFFPREQRDALLAALPNAVLSVYEETGHAVHWERPERFAVELECFVQDAHLAHAAREARAATRARRAAA